VPAAGLAAAHLVDAHRDAKDQRVVLSGHHLDAVGVSNPEPALRHLGDLVAAALDLVLVVDDIAFRGHVVAAFDLDGVSVAEADESFHDDRDPCSIAGLHFITSGAAQDEPGVIASLQENPSQLERVARSFSWTLDGVVEVMYRSPVDIQIDEWIYELLEQSNGPARSGC
jgi:hypothetical protein